MSLTIRLATPCGVCRVRPLAFFLQIDAVRAAFPEARIADEPSGLIACCAECAPEWALEARRVIDEGLT